MTSTSGESCCLGREVAGEDGVHSQDAVWKTCERGINRAIHAQLGNEGEPVILDALPTTGKTYAATKVLASFDLPGAIFTHLHDTRNAHLKNITSSDCSVVKLPSLEKDCPSASGEYGKELADRIRKYNDRGASPKYLHRRYADELPCMLDSDCEYLRKWEEANEADILIGHPVHAGLPEAVDGRIVIFDEDPGDAYRTDFSSSRLDKAISAFLGKREDLPFDNRSEVELAPHIEQLNPFRADLQEAMENRERMNLQSEAFDQDDGHAKAPAAVLALLQFEGPKLGIEIDEGVLSWGKQLYKRIRLEFTELPGGSEAVKDYKNGSLHIRNAPNLSGAEAVVGLDGTPTKEIWKGRLGVPSASVERILCDSCRQEYLKEGIGYQIIQTTTSVNPYSSGNRVNRRSCYGLIEAVASHHNTKVPVITTKKAEERLFKTEPTKSHIYKDRVNSVVSEVKHYGDLRSSNEFEGEEVGIVLGSPHPSDRPIQVTAAFEGSIAERGDGKGLDLSYGPGCDRFLHHYREHKVAQAIFRFGRTNASTVYVHTAALPPWLREMAVTPEDGEVEVELRGDGMRAIMHSLDSEGEGTVQEIAAREEVGFTENHVRDTLKRLRDEGIVERSGKQPYTWRGNEISEQPHTAAVTLPGE